MSHSLPKPRDPSRRFISQAIVSATPGVLLTANLPLIASHIGLTLASIGAFYFWYRLGFILSSVLGAPITNRASNRIVAASSEALNVLLSALIVLAYFFELGSLLSPVLCFKGLLGGLILIVRFHWLKEMEKDSESSKSVLVITNLISQISYGLAGVFLIFSIFNPDNVYWLAILDAATSAVGALLFLSIPAKLKPPDRSTQFFSFSVLVSGERRWLFLAEFFLACALGGTNLLLVEYGQKYFAGYGGYGLTLTLYALLYGVGGIYLANTVKKKSQSASRYLMALPVLPIALLALGQSESIYVLIFAFSLLFVAYALIRSAIDVTWFEVSNQSNSALIMASRQLLIGLVWALGEYVYARIDADTEIRAIQAAIAILPTVLYLWLKPRHRIE